MTRQIELRNVRVNNLKGIDLDIPHGQWLSICGLSGSGKTSLALDTLYAEGQRRYIESLSPYTRQFLQQLDKPTADRIDGMPPAIAVKATRGKSGPMTTVGSTTEILDHLRLLFSRAAEAVCSNCGTDVSRQDPQSVARSLSKLAEGTRFQIAFEISLENEPLATLEVARANGFNRVVIGNSSIEISSQLLSRPEIVSTASNAFVVVDRLKSDSPMERIRDSLETAFNFGDRRIAVLIADENGPETVDSKPWRLERFSRDLQCGNCQNSLPEPIPQLFSFSSETGACQTCKGTGNVEAEGQDLVCSDCQGSRLNQDALSFRFRKLTIGQMQATRLQSLLEFFDGLEETSQPEVNRLVNAICKRLRYLCQVGVGYLELNRSVRTLSGGEAQRVALTTSLASSLVNMLYVLDEPSMGLHPFDIGKLKSAITSLHQRGNTLVVIDHEPQVIRAAERVIEIGPAAGDSGGEIVFDGLPNEIEEDPESLTGDYLAGRRGVSVGTGTRRTPRGRLKIVGASGNNLQNLNVEFPLGVMCVVTGVSGAGKSSLVQKTLYGALCERKQVKGPTPLPYQEVFGDSSLEEIVLIDQSPIGRSARSNPVTYVKAFDDIRKAFAETATAKSADLKPSHFSFNVSGGRCEKCEGDGCLTVDMQFLADVVMKCDQCRGRRFRDDVLSVRYRGKDISEVLDLTVREAFSFFRGQPKVQAKLKNLIDVGLEYIRLGQPATRLSTGEAQRLKLAQYLNANRKGRSLFIMDEPTSGLHMNDVVRLLDCFDALLDVGHSMIIVEHNLQLIKHADWIIDLGPGAAEDGGQIVGEGTPEMLAENEESLTGQYLKPLLELVADD